MTVSEKPAPRRFLLVRKQDVTGVSGEGTVAEGIEYSDGVCSMHWIVPPARSTTVYNSIDDVIAIHGHQGATKVVFLDACVAV
jgi:hypothetical protein